MEIQYINPKPLNLNRETISFYAEKINKILNYSSSGKNIINIVEKKLGGKIVYLGLDAWNKNGGITIDGEKDFVIYLPEYTGVLRNSFAIAIGLGIYILYSRFGDIKMKIVKTKQKEIKNWNVINEELNCFATTFLMPEKLFRKKVFDYNFDAASLAWHFKVTTDIIKFRFDNLKFE